MKVKFLAALFGVALLGVFLFNQSMVKANSSDMELISGIVRVEIVEGTTENELSHMRFFIQRCNGNPCDFDALRLLEQGQDQKLPIPFPRPRKPVEIQNIYLDGVVDFPSLINKEVTFSGQYREPMMTFSDKGGFKLGFSQHFDVMQVDSVAPDPPQQDLLLPPLTMPNPTQGQRNVLVMLVNFQSAPTTPYQSQQIKDWVFTGQKSARQYFEDVSWYIPNYRGFSIKGARDQSGDVTPWLSLTASPTDCVNNIGNAWRIEADNLAAAQGFSKTAYQTRILLFAPIPGCPLGPAATVGFFGDQSGVNYVFFQLPASGSQQGLDLSFLPLVHEIEHNLGQGSHSNGQQVEGGATLEYGDNADTLAGNRIILNNNVLRLKFGWFTTAQVYPAISTRGTYRFKIQTPAVQTRGIGPNSPPMGAYIVLRDMSGNTTGEIFMLEHRRNYGVWDQFGTDTQAYPNGLAIRKVGLDFGNPITGSVIQDTTPSTPCCKDAPLVPDSSGSATWISSMYGVTITAFTPTVTGMWVTVTLGSNYPTQASLQITEGKALK